MRIGRNGELAFLSEVDERTSRELSTPFAKCSGGSQKQKSEVIEHDFVGNRRTVNCFATEPKQWIHDRNGHSRRRLANAVHRAIEGWVHSNLRCLGIPRCVLLGGATKVRYKKPHWSELAIINIVHEIVLFVFRHLAKCSDGFLSTLSLPRWCRGDFSQLIEQASIVCGHLKPDHQGYFPR